MKTELIISGVVFLNDIHFTIIILSYNCESWAKKNVLSAINQEYDNYDIIYINDASTDNTGKIVKDTVEEYKGNYKLIDNDTNKKALENLYNAVRMAKDKSIIVALDGDDRLINSKVLSHLSKIYTNKDVWITAGSYLESVGGRIVSPDVQDDYWIGNIRNKRWSFSHLRSFRKELFLKIQDKDFLEKDGSFYKFTWDRVIMYPMIEMAGKEHFYPVRRPLYIYNVANPISVDRVHRYDQLRIESELKQKQQYSRIDSLYD